MEPTPQAVVQEEGVHSPQALEFLTTKPQLLLSNRGQESCLLQYRYLLQKAHFELIVPIKQGGSSVPKDVLHTKYGHDYITELLQHFDGQQTLEEICLNFGYKIEPLRMVVEKLVKDGLLEVVSGTGDRVKIRIVQKLPPNDSPRL